MSVRFLGIGLAVFALAACTGPSGNLTPPGALDDAARTAPRAAKVNVSEVAMGLINATSFQLHTVLDEERGNNAPSTGDVSGKCVNGLEVYIPDKAGDKNSQEYLFFYDAACTSLAHDVVRKVFPLTVSGSEAVEIDVNDYRKGAKKPFYVHIDYNHYMQGAFDQNGYPVASHGFVNDARHRLIAASGRQFYENDTEYILSASRDSSALLCAQSAAYNQSKLNDLSEAFGAQGISSGTRGLLSDGSSTTSASFDGDASGADAFRINDNDASNTACPISRPRFVLGRGTLIGQTSGAFSLSFAKGTLSDLSASTTIGNDFNLTVETNTNVFPEDAGYVTGTVTYQGEKVAALSVNQFGNGTYTETKTGTVYVTDDWLPIGILNGAGLSKPASLAVLP